MKQFLVCLFVLFVTVFGELDFELVSVEVPQRFLPKESARYNIRIKNSGDEVWKGGQVSISIDTVTWDGQHNSLRTQKLVGETPPNGIVSIDGDFKPPRLGVYNLEVTVQTSDGPIGSFTFQTEQTCSDGQFCNGVERYINGKCVKGDNPCPSTDCYTATCDERLGNCSYDMVVSPECPICAGDICTPDCTDAVCGDDGCGGTCGTCATGDGCVDGACVPSVGDGSCAAPHKLIDSGVATAGVFVISGDTSTRVNEIVPSCNFRSDAKEMIYYFDVVGTPMGVEARVVGSGTFEDSVLEIRTVCQDSSSTIACSDDSTPPGGLFSRVKALLEPGRYYIFVDGYSAIQQGPFDLTVKFVENCVPQCDGSFCGPDSCGGTCGDCTGGEECYQTEYLAWRCKDPSCVPIDCTGKACGDDGCGGQCVGTCPDGQYCVDADGSCQSFPYCDHFAPVCTGCKKDEFCGTDCQCYNTSVVLPDFIVDTPSGVFFDRSFWPESSCAWYERCIAGFGSRRLLRFDSHIVNQGFAAFASPDPKTRPDLFKYSSCHNHYHFSGFANYELLNLDGSIAAIGHKQGYCIEDDDPHLTRPDVPCEAGFDCGAQGISAGWADSYGNSLDCQWIDITDTEPGEYLLQVTANWLRIINEESYDNNVNTIKVTIPVETPDFLVTISRRSISPDPVTLTAGQTVGFKNVDDVAVLVSWTNSEGEVATYHVKVDGYSALVTFDEAGTYVYTVAAAPQKENAGKVKRAPGKGKSGSAHSDPESAHSEPESAQSNPESAQSNPEQAGKPGKGGSQLSVSGTIVVQPAAQAAAGQRQIMGMQTTTVMLSGAGVFVFVISATLVVFAVLRYKRVMAAPDRRRLLFGKYYGSN